MQKKIPLLRFANLGKKGGLNHLEQLRDDFTNRILIEATESGD
jgi:hypothetical protein